jgi:hypothetical protein
MRRRHAVDSSYAAWPPPQLSVATGYSVSNLGTLVTLHTPGATHARIPNQMFCPAPRGHRFQIWCRPPALPLGRAPSIRLGQLERPL